MKNISSNSQSRFPTRTCIACRKKSPKESLMRLALDRQGRVVWDPAQSMMGRGAYICCSRECLTTALKRGRLDRAFRRSVRANALESSEVPWKE